MRILVLTQRVPDDALPEDRDVLVQREVVSEALRSRGHQVEHATCDPDLGPLLARLRDAPPDVVFNLVESLAGDDMLQVVPTTLVEALGLPCTGCSARALQDTNDKLAAKRLMLRHGIPTPPWVEANATRAQDFVPGRYIIKPARCHASVGIDDHSVTPPLESQAEALSALELREDAIGAPCFAELFIDGREINVSLLQTANGPQVLALAEIDFSMFPPGRPHIVGYAAKWDAAAPEYHATPRRFWSDDEAPALATEIRRLAQELWERLSLRGYARVDLRVDASERPWVLEVNANPCLSPDGGFVAAAAYRGLEADDLYATIVDAAIRPRE